MGNLFEFLEEDNGGRSHVRVIGFLITGAILFKNVYLSIKLGQNISITLEEVGVITAALGIKAWQKGKEQKVVEEKKQ